MCYIISKYFWVSYISSCYCFLVKFHCDLRAYTVLFLFFQIWYSVLDGLESCQSLWVFPVKLRVLCLLLLLHEVFYKCKVDGRCSVQLCPYWFAASWLSISDRRMLKSPAIWVDSYVSPCTSSSYCPSIWHCGIRCIHMQDCYVFSGIGHSLHFIINYCPW